MRSSVGLGFGIAALFAAGVLVASLFGRQDSFLEQAAQAAAVRCVTKGPCVAMDAHGLWLAQKPPITASSRCALRRNWRPVAAAKALLVTCRDGAAYLYHMGAYPNAGQEQWMVCKTSDCAREAGLFAVK